MDILAKCIMLALIGEAIVENIKIIYKSGKFEIDAIVALVICCLITVATQSSIFDLLEMNFFIPVIGQLLTGILISRGAGAFHDLLKTLQSK